MKKVAHDLNKVHYMFKERNPTFNGTVNLIGHSLGSLIIFDLISNLEVFILMKKSTFFILFI